MSRLFQFFCVFFVLSIQSVLCNVKSCYACAGPQSDCVSNRTDFFKMDCNTFKVEGESLIHRSSEPDLLERFDAEVGPVIDGETIGCLTLTFQHDQDSPKERALKTCVPANVLDKDICSYMEELVSEIGGQKTDCSFCKSDDCNSAISVTVGKVGIFLCLVYVFREFL